MARRSEPTPVDPTDRALIDRLADNGRVSMNELAAQVGISRANAYQRVNRLRDEGVIRRFTVDVDPKRIGLSVTALILADIEQHSWREIADQVVALPGVEYVGFMTGTFDIMLLVRAADMEELRDVVLERLQAIPEVRSTQTSFILDELRP